VRILYFADIRFPLERANGIQTMETCWALAARGHQVSLVVRPDTEQPARDPFAYYGLPAERRLIVERAPMTGAGLPSLGRRIAYLAFAAGRAAGSARADLVMTRDLAVASLLLRLPARPALVYEAHGYAPDVAAALPALVATATPPGGAKLRRLAKREEDVWHRADGYVTITAGLAREMERRFGARPRVAIVPDGTRLSTASATGGAPPGSGERVTVVYAGHLYAWKGVDILIDALSRVDNVKGLIVGGHDREPDLARVQAAAAARGIGDRVEFTGMVPPASVAQQLARGDMLVLPNPASAISTHATSPLKLFEYMAAGRAIVASDLPSIREVLTHDRNAWLVAPGDAEALAGGIRRLRDDDELRARLGAAARTDAAEYSWTRRAERLEALFSDVLAARSSR
jgi:glycosyltransferase involved in cell wall biosynthesis